jgi:hypothetical protein
MNTTSTGNNTSTLSANYVMPKKAKWRDNLLDRKQMFIICDCHSNEHMFALSYFANDEDEPYAYLTVHLSHWENFFRRLWIGIKYAFGYRSRYGDWDGVIINPKEARNIIEFLNKYLEGVEIIP